MDQMTIRELVDAVIVALKQHGYNKFTIGHEPKGVHSLRHTLASTMLAKDVPLPVISSVLGHITQKATSIYLHIDIDRLKECALDPEVFLNHANN